MSSTRGLVASTVPFSAVDGPGSRFVLFLQGCNFECVACHNPSTINLCDSCGICVGECPHIALEIIEGGLVFHPGLCDGCNLCVLACPTDASPIVEYRTVEEIAAGLADIAGFISGITVTGGEPTMQLDFLIDLFATVKSDPALSHLTTLVDTNGTLAPAEWERLAPVLDGAMVDLKAFSEELHRELTGQGNREVKESIRWLAGHGKLAEVRLLVIEGVTDDPEELEAWAGFVEQIDPEVPVRLMGFRHLGTRETAKRWPETTDQGLERVERILLDAGLTTVSAGLVSA